MVTNSVFQEGASPIHFAANFEHPDLVELLVDEYGVDPGFKSDVRNHEQYTSTNCVLLHNLSYICWCV